MSIELAESFIQKISTDMDLQVRCKKAASVAIVQVIREAGYRFTKQEFHDALLKLRLEDELDEQELQAAAGGRPSGDGMEFIRDLNVVDLFAGVNEDERS